MNKDSLYQLLQAIFIFVPFFDFAKAQYCNYYYVVKNGTNNYNKKDGKNLLLESFTLI